MIHKLSDWWLSWADVQLLRIQFAFFFFNSRFQGRDASEEAPPGDAPLHQLMVAEVVLP